MLLRLSSRPAVPAWLAPFEFSPGIATDLAAALMPFFGALRDWITIPGDQNAIQAAPDVSRALAENKGLATAPSAQSAPLLPVTAARWTVDRPARSAGGVTWRGPFAWASLGHESRQTPAGSRARSMVGQLAFGGV